MQPSMLSFMEQVRATAQSGLQHTQNPYDRERYQRLLDACLLEYSRITDLEAERLRSTLLTEIGTITPKCAANAAIFDPKGRLLLIRRSDDGKLSMPGGACEPGESPQETAVRETWEETGLCVEARRVIDVFCVRAGTYNQAVTVQSAVCHCAVVSGQAHPTLEATEVGFQDHRTVPDCEWHKDLMARAQRAHDYWKHTIRA